MIPGGLEVPPPPTGGEIDLTITMSVSSSRAWRGRIGMGHLYDIAIYGKVARELQDRTAEGRSYGNIGACHLAMGKAN